MFHTASLRARLRDAARHGAAGLAVVMLLIGGFWGSHYLSPGDDEIPEATLPPDEGFSREVTLPLQKIASAGIQVSAAKYREIRQTKTVAGTIDYDSTRFVSIESPVECVVAKLCVQTGQWVRQGDPLAEFSGAEVALARTEIAKCEADVRIAQIKYDWTRETHDNLTELLAALKTSPTVEEVETRFVGKLLGEHRDHLLTTYNKYLLASSVATRTMQLGEQGIIAGNAAEARFSQRDAASNAFQAACEQSEFESRQDLAKASAELDVARQMLAVAGERLRLLLGPLVAPSATGTPGDFELRAPFDGRVETLQTAVASRLGPGEPVLTLADTTQLWVSALIHQHDWDALQVAPGEKVTVAAPAIPHEEFTAEVSFVGPEVSPTTRAISLVARLDNAAGRFRPGMFAWVALPMEAPRRGLTVPASAIQRHESDTFVFVRDGERRYRRVSVSTGIETPEFVEITSGLEEGQEVVDHGAFFLKSELLLEQEAE